MSWKIVKIETAGKLSFDNNRIRFDQRETGKVFFFPTDDLSVLVIESLQISVTTALVAALAEKAVSVVFCNGNHRPAGVLFPVGKPLRQSEISFLQTEISKPLKKRMWQKIIRQKIINQSVVLKTVRSDNASLLQKMAEKVLSGDTENTEAAAARLYWESLFGKNFVRHDEDGVNAALDYGYAIFRNVLINHIVAHGLIATLGVHHHSVLNNFNLADDLFEPYRAFTDQAVFKITPLPDDRLTKTTRENLIALLQKKCRVNGQTTSLMNAVEQTVCSFVTAIRENDSDELLLPEFVDDDGR